MTKRLTAGIAVTIALCVALTTATVALLHHNTSITNTFEAHPLQVSVVKDDDKITVQNDSKVPVYIRMTLTPYFVDANGGVLLADVRIPDADGTITITRPDGDEEATITVNLGGKWEVIGGMYYYTMPVEAEGTAKLPITVTGDTDGLEIHAGAEGVQLRTGKDWYTAWN